MKMTEIKLKPCPFCGGKVRMIRGIMAGLTMVVCASCRATVSFGGQEERNQTVTARNRRADNAIHRE